MFRTLVYVYCFALYTIMLRNFADTMPNENESGFSVRVGCRHILNDSSHSSSDSSE